MVAIENKLGHGTTNVIFVTKILSIITLRSYKAESQNFLDPVLAKRVSIKLGLKNTDLGLT